MVWCVNAMSVVCSDHIHRRIWIRRTKTIFFLSQWFILTQRSNWYCMICLLHPYTQSYCAFQYSISIGMFGRFHWKHFSLLFSVDSMFDEERRTKKKNLKQNYTTNHVETLCELIIIGFVSALNGNNEKIYIKVITNELKD